MDFIQSALAARFLRMVLAPLLRGGEEPGKNGAIIFLMCFRFTKRADFFHLIQLKEFFNAFILCNNEAVLYYCSL
jgi:hypothetical protein